MENLKKILLFFLLFSCVSTFSQNCELLTISNKYPIITSPTCGVANGKIEVKATGNGEVMYSLNGKPFQSSGQFSELDDREHVILIRDEFDCEITLTVPLEGETPVEINKITTKNATCELDDGEIEIFSDGSGLEYSINGGRTFQFGNKFTNLLAGNYTILVRDSFGCTASESVIIGNGNIKFDSIQRENTECGRSDGQIVVNVIEGNGLEFQLLNFRGWQTSNVFNNLPIGTYAVQVRDSRGCNIRRNIRVGLSLDYELSVSPSDCGEENGSLGITFNSIDDYEFSFNNGTYSSQSDYQNLAQGRYNLKFRNKTNPECIIDRNITIGVDQKIQNVLSTSSPSFCNERNGTITITADGVGLNYKIIGEKTSTVRNNNTGIFENLPSDSYEIILGDTNECEINSSIVVVASNDISDEFESEYTASDCLGATGKIIFNANSLSGNEEYSINGGPFRSIGEFSNVKGGANTITVRSAIGCTKDFIIDVPEVNDISVEKITVDTPSFRCASDGRIVLDAKGTNIEFSLDGQNFQKSGSFTGLDAGTYIVTMKNSLGCLKETGQIKLISSFSLTGFDITPTTCYEDNGTVLVIATGDGMQFKVDGGEFQESNLFENLSTGVHNFLIKDENGCEIRKTASITNQGFVEIDNFDITSTFCGEPNGQISFTAYQESTMIEYSIDGITFKSDSLFTDLPSGQMMIWARDEFGCTDSLSVNIPASSLPILSYKFTPSICDYNNGTVEINHTGGVGNLIYSLNNSPFQKENRFIDLAPGLYSLDVEDEVGCMVSSTIEIVRDCKALFPTVITPNGNGENDLFKINYYLPLQINSLVIYNRWGDKLYTASNFISTDNSKWWNGGSQQDGSYLAYIEYIVEGVEYQVSTSFIILK